MAAHRLATHIGSACSPQSQVPHHAQDPTVQVLRPVVAAHSPAGTWLGGQRPARTHRRVDTRALETPSRTSGSPPAHKHLIGATAIPAVLPADAKLQTHDGFHIILWPPQALPEVPEAEVEEEDPSAPLSDSSHLSDTESTPVSGNRLVKELPEVRSLDALNTTHTAQAAPRRKRGSRSTAVLSTQEGSGQAAGRVPQVQPSAEQRARPQPTQRQPAAAQAPDIPTSSETASRGKLLKEDSSQRPSTALRAKPAGDVPVPQPAPRQRQGRDFVAVRSRAATTRIQGGAGMGENVGEHQQGGACAPRGQSGAERRARPSAAQQPQVQAARPPSGQAAAQAPVLRSSQPPARARPAQQPAAQARTQAAVPAQAAEQASVAQASQAPAQGLSVPRALFARALDRTLTYADRRQLSQHVTCAIKDVTDWQSLAAVFSGQQLVPYNRIHVAAAWQKLAHMYQDKARAASHLPAEVRWQSNSQYQRLLYTLVQLTHDTCHAMGAREASTVLWAAATLQHTLPVETLTELIQVVIRHGDVATSQDLSQTVWGVGKIAKASGLAVTPEPGTEPQALQTPLATTPASPNTLDTTQASPNVTTTTPPAAALASLNPLTTNTSPTPNDRPSQQHASQHAAAPSHQPAVPSQHQPGTPPGKPAPSAAELAFQQSVSQLAPLVIHRLLSMNDKGLAIAIHGLSMLSGLLPSADLASVVMSVAEERAPGLKPRDLATLLSSMVVVGCRPPERWLQAVVAKVASQLTQYQCEELVLFLYACAEWRFRPAPRLLLAICEHASRRFSTCSVRHLCLLVWSFSKLRWRPPPDWADALTLELTERHTEIHAQELTLLLYGLVTVSYIPEKPVMQVLLERVKVAFATPEGLSPMQLSTISWALPQLCPEVGSEIRYAMKKQFIRQSRDLTPEGFAKTLWGIARCALVAPGREWLHYAFRTFVARRAEMDPHALPMALWAFAKLGYHRTYLGNNIFTVHRMRKVWEAARPMMMRMHIKGLMSLIHASKMLKYSPNNDTLQEFVDCVGMHGASMNSQTFKNIASPLYYMRSRGSKLLALAITKKSLLRLKGKARQRTKQKIKQMKWNLYKVKRAWRPVGWAVKQWSAQDVSITVKGDAH